MVKLETSKVLKRKIRQDDLEDISIPTWSLVQKAIKQGKTQEALEFLDYGCSETKAMHDSLISFADGTLAVIAGFDEEAILRFFRERYKSRIETWLSGDLSVEEDIQRFAEQQRAHFSDYTIEEEQERYIMRGPCGSGGRLRRTKEVATTKKPYPWAWSKENIPYYCVHCCVAWEIIPTEIRGYPLRIHLLPENAKDPCVHLFYKKPEFIPERYFLRIGMTKTTK